MSYVCIFRGHSLITDLLQDIEAFLAVKANADQTVNCRLGSGMKFRLLNIKYSNNNHNKRGGGGGTCADPNITFQCSSKYLLINLLKCNSLRATDSWEEIFFCNKAISYSSRIRTYRHTCEDLVTVTEFRATFVSSVSVSSTLFEFFVFAVLVLAFFVCFVGFGATKFAAVSL